MNTTPKERSLVINNLNRLSIPYEDAHRLRRIAMVLHNWYELECGIDKNGVTVSIEREGGTDDGRPIERRAFMTKNGYREYKQPVPDREKGAIKRLDRLMKAFPDLVYYIQTDPRGASLYILQKKDLNGQPLDQIYSSLGIAVY